MNSKNIQSIKDIKVCMKCLKNKSNHEYYIKYRGYGSRFDSETTKLQVCDECNNKGFYSWFNEKPTFENKYVEKYKYEEDIIKMINSLPLESQELFYNRFSESMSIDPQDWIDYELDELPYKKCKQYGLYSSETKAYEEDF